MIKDVSQGETFKLRADARLGSHELGTWLGSGQCNEFGLDPKGGGSHRRFSAEESRQVGLLQKPQHENVLNIPCSFSRQTIATPLPKSTSSATAWEPTWLERQGAGLQAWAGLQVRPEGQDHRFCPQ